MIKRTWILILVGLALSVILGACGGNDLAKDLTPIPTLPQGEEPALLDALQAPAVALEPMAEEEAGGGEVDLVAQGGELFTTACASCHGAQPGAGPALAGMADRAATRVEGQSAEDYLHQSIVEPGAYIVEGYANIMPPNYGETYSEVELDALVAYIVAEGTEGAAAEAEPTEEPAAEATPEPTEIPTEEAAEPTSAPTEEVEAEDTEAVVEETEEAADVAVAAGNAEAGAEIYTQACSGCHGAAAGVGPSLADLKARAEEHAADHGQGQTVEEFLHESIVEPSAYVAAGNNDGIMPQTYGDQYSDEQLNDLVAYILAQ